MPLHGREEIRFGSALFKIERHIDRVNPEVVTVGAAWRAGPAVVKPFEIIYPLQRSGRQTTGFRDLLGHGRHVEKNPMHP